MPQTPRVAIVTGAARGIGAATAQRLAAEGHAVAVLDLTKESAQATVDAITEAGGKAIALGADVSDTQQVEAAVKETAERLGPPTILVNNAGVIRDNLLFKMTDDDWDTVMRVHLRGAFLMSRAAQAYMTEQGWGRIINLSSSSALGNRGQANYSAAKAALDKITIDLGSKVEGTDVMINLVDPGWCRTDLGGPNAPNSPESALPGVIIGAFMDDRKSGRIFRAQEYAGMTIEEAVAKASL